MKITSGELKAATEKQRDKTRGHFTAHGHLLLYCKDAEGSSFNGEGHSS